MRAGTGLLIALVAWAVAGCADRPTADWSRQLKTDEDYFPIGVWMQETSKAERFREMGVNLYVNLWQGPTNAQLAELADAGMEAFCEMAHDGRANLDNPVIVGWLHTDEPDNAQPANLPGRYDPPITPAQIAHRYRRIKETDPSRPVMVTLGRGVAWDQWHGRGERVNCPQDYPAYLEGCDMASFALYPIVSREAPIAGKLWLVGEGVTRLKTWSGGRRMVWAAVECSRITNMDIEPTAAEIRAEVWMAIIHGARGILYFAHQFTPAYNASPILDADHQALYEGVKQLNWEIHALASAINAPEAGTPATVASSVESIPIAATTRRVEDATYLFAVAMRDGLTRATFTVPDVRDGAAVEILGEGRSLTVENGRFADDFTGFQVHLYRISD
ncbi:MAG: hypothetical protein GX591_19815 [Planctomycetes bacterium]|nr:hypothetical protein [Planctomycetota bacterium]